MKESSAISLDGTSKGRNTSSTLLIIVAATWIALAIVFGLYDLDISKMVVNENATWAQFLADYGQWPGFILIGLAFLILPITFIVGKERDSTHRLRVFSVVAITLAILCPLLFVHGIKFFVSRVRFRDLASDFSNYTPWYLSTISHSTDNSTASFPSGHTAMAFMLIPLIFLFKDGTARYIVVVATVGYGILMAASRVVVGAHYASDVLFSACFAIIVTILLSKVFDIKRDDCACLGQDYCWCEV